MYTFRSLEEFDRDHGTVQLLDDSHRYKSKQNSDIVLVPQPTDDPNDPLNWPYSKKIGALLAPSFLALMAGWVISGLGSAVPILMEDFGTNLQTTVNATLNWPVLMLGLGVFWWVPFTLYFGVRPAALLASLIVLLSCVWGGASHNFQSLEASRVICAWAVSCGEILPGIIVKDIFFLHERGGSMGLYMIFFQCLPAVGVIISGFVISGKGWRWHFWLTAIVNGAIFLGIVFFLPETQYPRLSKAQAPSLTPSSSQDQSKQPNEKYETSVEEGGPPSIPTKKPLLQQLNPLSGIHPNGEKVSFFSLFIRSWPLIFYPAVAYSTLVFGVTVSGLLTVVNTAASVFQSPPYNMSPGIQSLIFIALIIGGAIGSVYGGLGTDLYAKYCTKKNNGIFEPESRLVLLIGPLVIGPAGLLMYAWCCADLDPWILAWVGLGSIGFNLAAIPAIIMSYAVDCYYPVAPEAIFLIVGLKNVISFGFSYAIIPWITAWGFKRSLGAFAGITFGCILLGLPLYLFGKKLRFESAKWKVIMW